MSVRLIDAQTYRSSLALRDLTDAAAGAHALQLLVQDAVAALRERWQCAVIVYRAPPLVGTRENYDDLGYPPDAAARDARYTRYVTPSRLLRTQTSAMIPGALRAIAPAGYDDVLLVCPGLTYRRDAIDRLHVGEPHQLDLWRIARRPLDSDALRKMIDIVAAALLPGMPVRAMPAQHPYTVDGLEVHGCTNGEWVEILECGRAEPRLLEACGLSQTLYDGLAMGIGLDRILMLRKGIADIRVLRSTDPRICGQMLDLAPYRPVSAQPAIQRDLSIAVAEHVRAEELGDRVREAIRERSSSIEAIEVLDETAYADLPQAARERLGITPGQKNVLLRIVLRDLERTLTSAEANVLRDDIYAALHEGSVQSWAAR